MDYPRLFQAVLLQAVADATHPNPVEVAVGSCGCELREQLAARAWLTRPSDELAEVCDMAGLEMSRVIRAARRLARDHWQRPARTAESLADRWDHKWDDYGADLPALERLAA